MEIFLSKALQLICSLSILVLVHEFGHFIFARLFKVRVEKFYLFFDPWFSLFKFKPKNGETEYGVGWLPLGGYCKISGMIDESLDKEALNLPPQPWEFRSQKAGPRLLIMTAGVIFNFILALIIYSAVLFNWGNTYIPFSNVTYGMEYSNTFKNIGFEDGDIPLKADKKTIEKFNAACLRQVVNAKTVTVLRNGNEVSIPIPDDMMQRLMRDKKGEGFARYLIPMIISEISSETAKAAGLLPGDRITAINDISTPTATDVAVALQNFKTTTAHINIVRAGETFVYDVPVDTAGHIGIIYSANPADLYETVTISYNLITCIPAGIRHGIEQLTGYVKDMKYVFTKEGAQSLGGFGAIGNMFPASWDWLLFWERTAFLSIILAFMNILPIPALDGGHVLFLLYEVITRRKPGDKFLERAQIVGMAILIALLLYANGNDIFRMVSG
ncbi:MAG: RIP metalloprotease RseP [Tannerella sp.]|jgi:regulator of sigma E protease|nr:RIP metalloprotease RseP [Tannerella sp.]